MPKCTKMSDAETARAWAVALDSTASFPEVELSACVLKDAANENVTLLNSQMRERLPLLNSTDENVLAITRKIAKSANEAKIDYDHKLWWFEEIQALREYTGTKLSFELRKIQKKEKKYQYDCELRRSQYSKMQDKTKEHHDKIAAKKHARYVGINL